jgi:uncharacterized protein (TIGR02246 family)
MKRFAILCAMPLIATLSACNSANHDADIKALRDTETQWNQEYVFKDVDKIMAHYADDAVLMAPGTPISKGKPAIHEGLKAMLADPALSLKFNASNIEVARSGDIAYTQGAYTMTMTDPQTKQIIKDHGSYITTYRKQPDGSWKAVADIASSELPPSTPSPSAMVPTATH